MRLICLTILLLVNPGFSNEQKKHPRVRDAYQQKEETVRGYFHEKKLSDEKFSLFIRAFKKERQLEVWIKEHNKTKYVLLHTYDICSSSGTLGPKRREGDLQVPEGVYAINHFNPQSNFHLSLGLNYPNASDKILSDKNHPGGEIYLHGNCVTVGCIPITDDKIKELYILAVEAKSNGQASIPVHIFPCRMDDNGMNSLRRDFPDDASRISFWQNLKPIYADFEKNKVLTDTKVKSDGTYYSDQNPTFN
ncbi:L,D-transpeptidase family protein [Chryseolinea sp. T2]|uniref:L,D-transpeptidase family protein n=1 Tax=Chryseolinea sp. T2 TaxID=3129255 RepID=UPI0030777422